MKQLSTVFLFTICAVLLANARADKMSQALREMVEAERAFSKYSVEHGQPEAWLEFFTDDGIIFKGGPINAKEFNRTLIPTPKPFTGALSWEPRYGDIAGSGDMGYNFGPWIYTSYVEPKGLSAYGYFITVWRKQPDGKWKEAFDFGTPLSKPTEDHTLGQPFTPARRYSVRVPKGTNAGRDLQELTQLDSTFSERTTGKSPLALYDEQISADAKVLRIAMTPGEKSVLQTFIPSAPNGRLAFSPLGGEVAKSSDLGYTFGKYELIANDGKKETGHYTHVWKRDEAGRWTIVMTGFRPDQFLRQN